MKDKLTIVKVGGKVVEDADSLSKLLHDFSKIQGYKVLVHGGGRSATNLQPNWVLKRKWLMAGV